jgi:AsmA protein
MLKRVVRWSAIAAAVLLVLALALPFLVDANTFRPQLESELSKALARDVKVGDLRLALLSGGVAASDLSIADDAAFSRAPFVQAKKLEIGVELLPLIFSRKLNVTRIHIVEPQIAIVQSPAGEWNFSTLGAKSAPKPASAAAPPSEKLDLSVKKIEIANGRFSLARAGAKSKPLVLEKVDAELRDFSAAVSFPFSLSAKVVGGGDIHADGAAGPLADDLSRTPGKVTLKIAGFDLAGSGWTQATPGMGGVVRLDGTASSTGKLATVDAKLAIDKLKLAERGAPAARPVEVDLALTHDLAARAGRIGESTARIGKAQAAFSGSYATRGETTDLRVSLAGPEMPVAELAAILPALAIALPNGATLQGGTARVKLSTAGDTAHLVTNGTVALSHVTLANFDLGRKMAVVETLAGMKSSPNTEIQELSTDFAMGPEGITTENLKLVVPSMGELGGAGKVSKENALDFHMNAHLHTAGVLAAVAEQSIPFTVQGTCADPVFRPDVKSVVKENAKSVGVKAAQGLFNRFLGGKK